MPTEENKPDFLVYVDAYSTVDIYFRVDFKIDEEYSEYPPWDEESGVFGFAPMGEKIMIVNEIEYPLVEVSTDFTTADGQIVLGPKYGCVFIRKKG